MERLRAVVPYLHPEPKIEQTARKELNADDQSRAKERTQKKGDREQTLVDFIDSKKAKCTAECHGPM